MDQFSTCANRLHGTVQIVVQIAVLFAVQNLTRFRGFMKESGDEGSDGKRNSTLSHLSSLSLLAHLARSVSRARLLPNPHLALGKCVEEADTIRLPSVFSKEHLQKLN